VRSRRLPPPQPGPTEPSCRGQVAVVSDDHGPVLLVRVRDVRQLAAVPGLSPAL